MSLRPAQVASLRDGQDRDLGRVAIERVQGDLVFGQFTPGPGFPQVERLFAAYVEAANEQLLSTVGEVDERIGALGLRLHAPDRTALPAIYDVQIGEGVITFRTRSANDDAPLGDTASRANLPATAVRSDAPTG
jgi:hypothetical protein